MKVIKKPLTELRRPDRNVRMHTDKQLKEFRRSVEMFGQIRPIVSMRTALFSPATAYTKRCSPSAAQKRTAMLCPG